MQSFQIASVVDLMSAKEFMVKTQEDISIDKISSVEYKIKLKGGSYNEYNLSYLDANVAKIILDYQEQYNLFLDGLERKFNIQIPQSERMLKFRIDNGCLEILTDLKGVVKEGFSRMRGWQIMVVFIVAIGGWYARDSYHKYLDVEIEKISAQKDVEQDKIRNEALSTLAQSINTLVKDRDLQAPANHLKRTIAATLQENEQAFINTEALPEQNKEPITNEDKDKFRVVLPATEEIPDIEEEIENIYHVGAQHFEKGKPFKLKEIKVPVNSEIISVEKRMQLIRKAEKIEPIRLKIKLIKDGASGDIKNAYILDVLD